jgi:hypothetical protein
MAKHKVNEFWKEGREWKLQAPNGIMTFKRKTAALQFAFAYENGQAEKARLCE